MARRDSLPIGAAASAASQETSPLLGTKLSAASTSASDTSSLLDSDTSTEDGSLPISYGIYNEAVGRDVESNLPSASRQLAREAGSESRGASRRRSLLAARAPKEGAQATILQVIVVLLIGVFTSNADGSLVLATHPVIASEFNVLSDSTWLFISFSLAGASTQALYAKLGDIYGRKALLLWSYALFAIGCALVGVGRTYWQVILGRVVSGSGGSGMTTLVAVYITDLVPLREVASWQSYLNIVATIGRSLGGPLGGILADTIGWRWSFLGQAPLFVIALILCWRVLPRNETENGSSHVEGGSRLARIDFLGAFFLGAGILALMLPLEIGGEKVPWKHPLILVLFGSGTALLLLFLATEAWWAKEPIFPLLLLRQKDVVASYVVTGCQLAAQIALMYSVPLYFQVTARASNTVAGAHLFPAVAGNAVGGMVSGLLIKRSGRYKNILLFGIASSAVSYLVLILRWHGHTNWLESMYIIPGGFGTGIAQSAVFISLQAAIHPQHKAAAASGLFLTWPVGMTLGLAAVSATMLDVLRKTLDARLIQLGIAAAERDVIMKDAVSSVDFLDKVNGDIRSAVVAAYVAGLKWSHGISLLCSFVAFLAALLLTEHKL